MRELLIRVNGRDYVMQANTLVVKIRMANVNVHAMMSRGINNE